MRKRKSGLRKFWDKNGTELIICAMLAGLFAAIMFVFSGYSPRITYCDTHGGMAQATDAIYICKDGTAWSR